MTRPIRRPGSGVRVTYARTPRKTASTIGEDAQRGAQDL